jgi:urease accessory protein
MMTRRLILAVLALLAGSAPALAHLDPVEHGSFAAGFTHPLFGADHLLAMIAVGLWAALIGGRAMWIVPAGFVGAMLFGFLLAMTGVGLPFVEPLILASVVVIGLVTMLALRLPAAAGTALVGFFALFHGHAHGGEMGEAGMIAYAAGFAVATALLHAIGIGIGLAIGRHGETLTRIAGGLTAAAGLYLALAG